MTTDTQDLVCIANISSRERRKRLNIGLVQLAVALMIFAILVGVDADRAWRLILFLPFWGAAAGVFQWLDKT